MSETFSKSEFATVLRNAFLPCFLSLLVLPLQALVADGPEDNRDDQVRPIPPIGIELKQEERQTLLARCDDIRSRWDALLQSAKLQTTKGNTWQKANAKDKLARLERLTSEILVFPRAIRITLEFQQFYKPTGIQSAQELLDEAERRIEVASQQPDWQTVIGIEDDGKQQLIVGGFQSKLDGSYQPYALVIPAGYRPHDSRPRRLDLWFHGRGEKLSEVNFLTNGRKNAGQYTPDDTFVLHPYGRYSNAFKFAGEIDVLEALDHVKAFLPVDQQRISARGFSMGGAACWQFATHYSDRFFAANPGAGFSETPEFLKSFQGEDLSSTPDYQRTLWQLYDCPLWSRNLLHCPTVAYSGEIDRQKQAADVMEGSLSGHGIDLVHIIGPNTAHKIHPDSKLEIERRMHRLAQSALPSVPNKIELTTYTLRYNRMHWVRIQGMQEHWRQAKVTASIKQPDSSPNTTHSIEIETENVTSLQLNFQSGQWTGSFPCSPIIKIDGTDLTAPAVTSDRSLRVQLMKIEDGWAIDSSESRELRKRPGLQGPIDDAFMDSFLFVTPSQTSSDKDFQAWCDRETKHAMLHWRKHFRGDVRSVPDNKLTEDHIANHNLVAFGDPTSNLLIKKIAGKLPVQWKPSEIRFGDKAFPRKAHAVAMIFPNPLNSNRYIVLNSGFTYREYDYLNNARQTPKLPDWAVVDVSEGANFRTPGTIKAAGFFNESWRVKSD